MFQGKDHIHPFNGGATTLKILRHFKIIEVNSKEEENEFARLLDLIEDSRDPVQKVWKDVDPEDNLCQHVHSHKNLLEIFKILWNPKSALFNMAPRGSFADHIFRIVFFHQSLPGVKAFPPMV